MALPMQLRIKTTSERLRTNHIDLLEYTEKLSKENERLKKSMEKVLRSTSLPDPMTDAEGDEEAPEDEEKAKLKDEVKRLQEELVAVNKKLMSSEIDKKTMKARAQLNQPNNDERLSNLRARLEEETRRREEGCELLQGAQDEIRQLEEDNASLREELNDALEKARGEQEVTAASMQTKEQEKREVSMKLNKILTEMDGMSDYHSQCMDAMMGSFKGEMERKIAAERDVQEKQAAIIDSLTEELNAARAEAQFRRKTDISKRGVIEDSSGFAVEPLPRPSSGLCPRCKSTRAAGVDKSNRDSSDINKVSFPEHVMLLEENRVLKIQLANAEGPPRQSSRSQRRQNSLPAASAGSFKGKTSKF